MKRSIYKYILSDLSKKMVFLVGPRQVGKTWLAKRLMEEFKNPQYLNYDDIDDRKIIENKLWPKECDFIVFDEIHKMAKWKNFLKGVYDTKPVHQIFLITGSARLETFQKSGDSLAGRFFSYKLLPLTISEIEDASEENFERLLTFGGFPEPYLCEKASYASRWRMQYTDGLIRTDILDFEKIHDFKAIQLVFKLLRKRVGSPISYLSIARDVQITPTTVKKYIEIFESLFIIFRVTPYSNNIARSILKEPKIYFYDTGLVECDDGIIFENMVALELLKKQQQLIDLKGIDATLNYIRTKDNREIDFCLVEEGAVKELIEVKLSDRNISKHLLYFCKKYNLNGVQLVKNLQNEYDLDEVKVRNAFNFLKSM